MPWKDAGDTWHDGGTIDCLKAGQHVRLGVVRVNDPGFGTDLVAWVDCSKGMN